MCPFIAIALDPYIGVRFGRVLMQAVQDCPRFLLMNRLHDPGRKLHELLLVFGLDLHRANHGNRVPVPPVFGRFRLCHVADNHAPSMVSSRFTCPAANSDLPGRAYRWASCRNGIYSSCAARESNPNPLIKRHSGENDMRTGQHAAEDRPKRGRLVAMLLILTARSPAASPDCAVDGASCDPDPWGVIGE